MPLTKAQCTNCGGTLEIDSSKEAAICPFCNTPYIVEKAINLYKTENHVTNNITYYGDGIIPELKIKNAWILIRDNHIDAAVKLLDEYVNVNPNDYRVWLGYYFCRNKEDRASLASATEKSTSGIKVRISSQLALIDEIGSKSNDVNRLKQRQRLQNPATDDSRVVPLIFVPLGLFFLWVGFAGISWGFLIGIACICIVIGYIIYKRKKADEYRITVSEVNNAENDYGELLGKKRTNDKYIFDFVMKSFDE